jgi:hypothetical protein
MTQQPTNQVTPTATLALLIWTVAFRSEFLILRPVWGFMTGCLTAACLALARTFAKALRKRLESLRRKLPYSCTEANTHTHTHLYLYAHYHGHEHWHQSTTRSFHSCTSIQHLISISSFFHQVQVLCVTKKEKKKTFVLCCVLFFLFSQIT